MSISTLSAVMVRIKDSSKKSPIAVFICENENGGRVLNAVFASTINTQKLLESPPANYVGTFDGKMSQTEVRYELNMALRSECEPEL